MNTPVIPVTVTILDKEYRVACPPDERDALVAAAAYLNTRLKEVRDGGKVIGAERGAIIAALNIANDLLKVQAEKEAIGRVYCASARALNDKIDVSLSRVRQLELQG